MNGWNVLLVLLCVLAVVYASAEMIEVASLQHALQEADEKIKERDDKIYGLEQTIEEKNKVIQEAEKAGCTDNPGTRDGAGSQQGGQAAAASGQISTLAALVWVMGINLVWLTVFVIYRVYANAVRGTCLMRVSLEEAEKIRSMRADSQ